MEAQQKSWQAREAEYVGVINQFAERLPAAAPQEPSDEPDPMLMKAAERLTAPLRAQMMAQQDSLDSMQFMNSAAMMGASPEEVGESEKLYQQWRGSGMRTVDAKGNERHLTRMEALDLVMGRGMRATRMKEAPTKNLAALRQQLVGAGDFGGAVGRAAPEPSRARDFDEIEKLPLEKRIAKREERLDETGF
jgi:hypothetical protein